MDFTAKFAEFYEVTLTVSPEGYGSIDIASIDDQLGGTQFSADGNMLTVGTVTVTATPAEAPEGYIYRFIGWFADDEELQSGTIVSPTSFTAKFIQEEAPPAGGPADEDAAPLYVAVEAVAILAFMYVAYLFSQRRR